jgi:DegV family protein with EDD domain
VTVRVVVDSTADIPPERARALRITVVPLTVHFGDETYRDGIDLNGPEFYRKLAGSHVTPTTSTPPPGLFEEVYRSLIRDGATGILALHIGSELSATYQVSRTAADIVSGDTGVPIAVYDSRQVSGAFGLIAELLAHDADAGASLDQLKARAESLLARTHLVAVVDTLEYLKRGGRIGGAKAFLGTLLSMKPILEVKDSQVLPVERVRTRSKAQERVAQLIAQLGPLEALAVIASDEAVGAQLDALARAFYRGEIEHFPLGPTVGTHAGPGAGGYVAITKA